MPEVYDTPLRLKIRPDVIPQLAKRMSAIAEHADLASSVVLLISENATHEPQCHVRIEVEYIAWVKERGDN